MKRYVQQIMLGTVTANEAAARDTLGRIKTAGYDGLELNRFRSREKENVTPGFSP